MQKSRAKAAAEEGAAIQPAEQTMYTRLFDTRTLAGLLNLSERGTWTPEFSFQGNGDSEIEVIDRKGDYFNLGS